ncbi:MAG: hypothetical protein JO033_12210 [Acidobacteriaceae bacterium]|nr:hypothetical protein [Acidobacteriaceae bacterium]MBV9498557.1 hypothetical protein [Acidobacteriaceae bacterium]
MQLNRKLNLLLSIAGMCLTAGLLGAAEIAGSFTLPVQTEWGRAVLPPGNYTFTLDRATLDGHMLIRRGNDGVALLMAQGMEETSTLGGSSLRIVAGKVRSLHLAPAGLTYSYGFSHEETRTLISGVPRSPGVSVAITTK